MRPSAPRLAVGATIAPLIATAVLSGAGTASADAPRALLVGSFNHIPGQFTSIQAAVDAAHPGDVILVGPGDYKEKGHAHPTGKEAEDPSGVVITTPGITLRGMDRNAVIVDGTRAGAPACSGATADQDLGPAGSGGPAGRNGIVDFGASRVAIENLTVCNYLSSASGGQGNEIWWNFGDGSGKATKGVTFSGQYLTATATYFKDVSSPMGMYGIFTSNADADPAHPAVITQTYASNMGDSAYYIGACDDCNQILDHANGVHSALGFSGTNAGGRLRIQFGDWYDNQSGIVPNALNNDDAPPPPDGGCPGADGTKPLGSHCTIILGNHVHDNNDPNVPSAGIAGAAPVGTGIELSGTRNDLVAGNIVERQGSWGILLHDYPDTETPPAVSQCQGGIPANQSQSFCYFQSFANEVRGNVLRDNGYFKNPSNSDLADLTSPNADANCFHGNRHDDGATMSSDPPAIQTVMGRCGVPGTGDLTVLLAEVACASGAIVPCPNLAVPGVAPIAYYPRRSTIFVRPMPTDLPTMPDPCAGVPANPWCGGGAAPVAATTRAGVLGEQSGSASVVLGPSALPMTSGPSAAAGAVSLAGGALLAPTVLALRRRRRRRST